MSAPSSFPSPSLDSDVLGVVACFLASDVERVAMLRVWRGMRRVRARWLTAAIKRARTELSALVASMDMDMDAFTEDYMYLSDELLVQQMRHQVDYWLRDWTDFYHESDNSVLAFQLFWHGPRSGLTSRSVNDWFFMQGVDNSQLCVTEPFYVAPRVNGRYIWHVLAWNAVVSAYLHRPWSHTTPFDSQRNARKEPRLWADK